MLEFFQERRPHNGLTFEDFIEQEMGGLPSAAESDSGQFIRLNHQRTKRILKTYTPSEDIQKLVQRIQRPQLWLVLTEAWCGDSAQVLPCIAKIAACNSLIDLRILLRDENLDIMDLYLTDGKRSIPKLIAFSDDGRELFQWGPRPAPAAALVREGLARGEAKSDVYARLHAWYARDRGCSTETELAALIAAQL